ncbi:DUF6227 family protein [Streptomyces subrutilus]|uniref:Uncharacterized protein n=1 Tax=Streptomyces subrutilus TaxID=36818 RepID=A0A5P2UM38_9ACTN|nr:DUF6227 family protein [Streptomyces subrutilus]QEU80198.1 hypothetical protein CP968_19475 [Streptomyces subrutilus]WSJ30523.1 DUF6227 family protein [Streptomyces subrutilus]GGZ49737.1 hypothetical protein GCM10010371_06360 [Streptomyces subrutilus]
MSDPYETTEAHLDRLLGRALNSFDLPDPLVERLGTALAHSSSLYTTHRSPATGAWRESHRHTYLLADGGSVSLWELAYRQESDRAVRYEVFASRAEIRPAVVRLFGEAPAEAALDPAPLPGDAEPGRDPAGLSALFAAADRCRREYTVEESADHARRVLRRAENADRPGAQVAARLRSAYGHRITQAFGTRASLPGGRDAGFSLYEHAFVLLDGAEVSLWEVEHTATPDGRHMCEVYESEEAARGAMRLRARVR